MSDRKQQLLDFVKEVKWEEYVNDPVVAESIEKIQNRVKEIKGGGTEENASGIRIKLVVVGDGAVGKTSLLIRFSSGSFPTEYLPTVFENYTTQMKSEAGQVLLHLWDTAGQEEYDRLRPLSYPRSDVIFLCFSTISPVSFESVKSKWWPEVHHYVPSIPYILVGTKIDLRESNTPDPNTGKVNPVTKEQAEALVKEIGCDRYMEISSKEGRGVNELFNTAVREVLIQRGLIKENSQSSSAVGSKKKKEKSCLLL